MHRSVHILSSKLLKAKEKVKSQDRDKKSILGQIILRVVKLYKYKILVCIHDLNFIRLPKPILILERKEMYTDYA